MQFSDSPSIKELSINVQKVIRFLRNASNLTLDFQNEFFESKIELIKKHRKEFHSIAIKTIDQCSNLARFGEELMILIESCNDGSISNQDISEYLRTLLNDAERNKIAIEDINSNINSLVCNMSNIYNDLAKYDLNGGNNIDTKTSDELKKTELRKKYYKGPLIL